MADTLILTFAEMAFLLQPHPGRAVTVLQRLGVKPEARTEAVAAAGAASLLARGLCRLVDGALVPGDDILAVPACVASLHDHTEVVSWTAERPVLMHLLSSPAVRLAIFPAAYGLMTVEAIDAAEPLADPVVRLMERCATADSAAVAVRTSGRDRDVSAAVARNADGSWVVSDSEDDPAAGRPVTRQAALARLSDLLGPQPVGSRS
jgi:hypothetical protein